MRATEFITELFQPGKQWQWSFTGSQEAVAVFHVGNIPYQFHAYTYADEDPTVWEIEFKNASRNAEQGRSTKFGLTGTGNSAEVMSTIADIMREFLQRYQGSISELTFTADEPSRRALYARMAKRLLPAWEIVQSGKNFTLVAPETVTEDHAEPRSAGCIIVAEDTGRWCLQQRSDTVTDPGVWSTWGGGVEPGETLEQAVRRELAEEGGYVGPLALEPLHSNAQYATFIGRVPHEFEPQINQESKSWCWVDQDQLPEPLHPGLEQALNENFADGRKPGRKGLAKRSGVNCKQSVSKLRSIAKNSSGERQRMAHWCANMKSGRNKNK